MAKQWEEEGSEFIHIVDLDGAKMGESKNLDIIFNIVKELKVPIQLGGGIRNIESIEKILLNGVKRVILGTSAVENQEMVKEAVKKFNDGIAIGIDAKDGIVAINGWEKKSTFGAVDFAKKMEDIGVGTIIYTDISRDGMLIGPNYEAMAEMKNSVNINVIASGGVSKKEDVIKLKEAGLDGAIIGKALYTGDIKLKEVLEIAKSR